MQDMRYLTFVYAFILSLVARVAAQTTSSQLTITSPANNTVYAVGQSIKIAWSTPDTSCSVCLSVVADTGQVTSLGCNSGSTGSSQFTIPSSTSVGSYWLVASQCGQTAEVRFHIGAYSTYTVTYTSATTSTKLAKYTPLVTVTTTAPARTTYVVVTSEEEEYHLVPYTITTNIVETVQSVGWVAAY